MQNCAQGSQHSHKRTVERKNSTTANSEAQAREDYPPEYAVKFDGEHSRCFESEFRWIASIISRVKMNIRQATAEDLLEIQYCNQQSLPTTYKMDALMEFQTKWPELMFVAEEDHLGRRIVGYVMGKM